MTDEEIIKMLYKIDERTKTIQTAIDNHLAHHFKYNILAWGIVLAAIIGLIVK